VVERQPRLGIDIGRVIINGPADSRADTGFFTGDEAALLATPEVPGAVDAIARLLRRFDGRVWLVSKCGPRVQARTQQWLTGHDFFARTGLPAEQVRFCRRRVEKRAHCVALGLTHFVDDRPEVHAAIKGVVTHQYLFGPQAQPVPDYAVPALTWADVERLIEESLAACR